MPLAHVPAELPLESFVTKLVGALRELAESPRGAAMDRNGENERATEPEDLGPLFVKRANAGDVDGLVALYESDAVLALPSGSVANGSHEIRQAYEKLLAGKPRFEAGEQPPALRLGNLALTSTRLVGGGATAEVARRQSDGTWLWVIDRPNVLG